MSTTLSAEPDDLPLCSEAAANDLSVILEGTQIALMPIWLRLLAEQRQRVPEHLLPTLFDQARNYQYRHDAPRNNELWANLVKTIGTQGQQRMAENPEWRNPYLRTAIVDLPPESVWEIGTYQERATYLRVLRRTDPALARTKLEAIWDQVPDGERVVFLWTFKESLSMEDEQFLESVFDVRDRGLSYVAQDVLRGLPESRLCQRMRERAGSLVRLSDQQLEVKPPTPFDLSMALDGMIEKPASRLKIGKRLFWLQQILAATPVSFWTTHLGKTPHELVVLATANEKWGQTLLDGWTYSLYRQLPTPATAEWADALLRQWLLIRKAPEEILLNWRDHLTLEQVETIAIEHCDFRHLAQKTPYRNILQECGPVWSRELTRRFLETFRQNISQEHPYALLFTGQEYDSYIPEEMFPEFADLWSEFCDRVTQSSDYLPAQSDYYRTQLAQFSAQVQFRRAMRQHILGA